MKKTILLWVVTFSVLFGTEINWTKDYKSAFVKAKNSNKSILMLVDSPNCPYCQVLKEKVFSSKSVLSFINENFIAVLSTQNDGTYLANIFEVYGTPTTFL